MPKINVYLPEDLAEGVKATGLPVSAICQRALEQSVRRVTAIRATALDALAPGDPTERLSQFTERARTAVRLGIERARADHADSVGTEHLLHGVLAEGTNLALHVLRAVEIDPGQVERALTKASSGQPGTESRFAARFSVSAANALELAVTEAIGLGHNYIGCEHLLLGTIAEPEGTAGAVLRELGAEPRPTRQAIVAALSGYDHLRATTRQAQADPAAMITAAVRRELSPLLERIERLERRAHLDEK